MAGANAAGRRLFSPLWRTVGDSARRLASGQHLLLSAPTGGGQTLAAFLPFCERTLTANVEEMRALWQGSFALRIGMRSDDSTVTLTRDTYNQVLPQMDEQACDVIKGLHSA